MNLKTISKNSSVQLEQLNDHLVLVLATDNKTETSTLYLADTESFLLSEVQMPSGSNRNAHIAVRGENEVIIGCGNRLTLFNPLTQTVNKKMVHKGERWIGQCHYLGKRYVTTLYDSKLYVIDNKRHVQKFYDLSAKCDDINNFKLKDIVYLPGNYMITYGQSTAFIVDLNSKNEKTNIKKLVLPEHVGIENIAVDSHGKCHVALKRNDGKCSIYQADMTTLKIDRAAMTDLLSNLKSEQGEGKLILSGDNLSKKYSRTKLMDYLKALFPVVVKARQGQIILYPNAECNMSQMAKFIEGMKQVQEKEKVVTAHYDRIESPRGPVKAPQRGFFKRGSGWKRRAPKKGVVRGPVKSLGLSRSSGKKK